MSSEPYKKKKETEYLTEQVMRDKKEKTPVEPTLIGELESGGEILKDLVRKHHHHLASVNILLLCTNKAIKSGGRERPGKVQKATPLVKFLGRSLDSNGEEPEILITVSLPLWNDADLTQRTAILDHLLTHVQTKEDDTTGENKLTLVSPELAEFVEIVERYGANSPALLDLKNALSATPDAVKPVMR